MSTFTHDLIEWIERHLNGRLTIEDVALKAGYSKWHLQRLFREETGYQLASYIRFRKLNKAAMLLKMTPLPAVEIGEYLGFSTQQTFTRSFTRHFGVAPGRYRETHHWNFRGMVARVSEPTVCLPEAETLTHGPSLSPGVSLSYLCEPDELENINYHCQQRERLLSKAFEVFNGILPPLVAEQFEPEVQGGRAQFTMTFHQHAQEVHYQNASPDRFLRFQFSGTHPELVRMQASVYQYVMPFRPEVRRKGPDFFVCHSPQTPANVSSNGAFTGHYYIPVSAPEPLAASAQQASPFLT